MATAIIRVDGCPHTATEGEPFRFGRVADEGVVGLDAGDMGISARAGAIEWAWNVWWVVNLSAKRPLLLEAQAGARPVPVRCGDRHALTGERATVLVPGAVFTHVLEVVVPPAYARRLRQSASRSTTGTLPSEGPTLTSTDRDVLTALCRGYLESFPRRTDLPASYAEAAATLGGRWTATRVRKHVERIKVRFAERGLWFEGQRANHELAVHLTENGLLAGEDLARLTRRMPAP